MSMLSAIKLLFTIDCRHAMGLISHDMDRDLSMSEALALRLHLAVCRACRRARSQFRDLRDMLRRQVEQDPTDTSPPAALDEAARSRIKHALADRADGPDD